ncbi:hypothetical protein C8R46DRAFT_1123408 [Mycena filopes]|nr:hypothetical protein C8R46DRAFT_1123408 [Mycena filopes]
MGWFDDNHPMGSRAEEEMEDAIESMGWNKWYKDPQPAGGSSEPARVERPESEWDETKWRKTNLRDGDTMAKGKAKTTYLLTDKDLLPLQYQKETNSRGFHNMKMYRKREVERLSWRKYGGPNGLKAAYKATGAGKATSSASAATGAKIGVLGKGKGKAGSGLTEA